MVLYFKCHSFANAPKKITGTVFRKKTYASQLLPVIEVKTKIKSATENIQTKTDFINDYDFHIVAIGSQTMIEEFILKAVIKGKLIKPTFIFWVEPF